MKAQLVSDSLHIPCDKLKISETPDKNKTTKVRKHKTRATRVAHWQIKFIFYDTGHKDPFNVFEIYFCGP